MQRSTWLPYHLGVDPPGKARPSLLAAGPWPVKRIASSLSPRAPLLGPIICRKRGGRARAAARGRRSRRSPRSARRAIGSRRRARPPRGATTKPAAPLTSAGRRSARSRANVRACGPRPPRRGPRATDGGAAVDAQHHVGVEHREQRLEVARPRGRQEGVDHLALARRSASGAGAAPRTRRRARLASCRAAAGSGPRSARSRRTAPRTCRAARTRAARRGQRLEHDQQREPTESASSASCSGSMPSSRLRSARAGRAERLLAPRRARAQHVQRHARHHRRQPAAQVLDVVVSERLSRSHASWTASSASLTRAEHPVGDRPQVRAVGLEAVRQPSRSSIRHILRRGPS